MNYSSVLLETQVCENGLDKSEVCNIRSPFIHTVTFGFIRFVFFSPYQLDVKRIFRIKHKYRIFFSYLLKLKNKFYEIFLFIDVLFTFHDAMIILATLIFFSVPQAIFLKLIFISSCLEKKNTSTRIRFWLNHNLVLV